MLTFSAHAPHSRLPCYANATPTHADQAGKLRQLVECWHTLTGHDPLWLYFDSKLAPYAELSRVNQRGLSFVTIRRRGTALLRRLQALPSSAWQRAELAIPNRRHRQVRYVDQPITPARLSGLPTSAGPHRRGPGPAHAADLQQL